MQVTLSYSTMIEALSVKKLKKVINDRMSELVPALTSGLSFYLESARYSEGSLEILDIHKLSDHEYSMSYRYKWTIFNACLDINAEEYINESVIFSVTESSLCFDIIDNSRPSTADEL
ncbi:hypothetical protein [Serratia liquefaciens]|uniref:hypothetical protein n=1 Tax=Serratia liquefaciens TaxID=614 RepID=UPI002178A4AB|nr:hypothetical protein [Serratia liquefaciens]CAI1886053.1 Uncharacterised protein [Serratia liquefaciens]